MAIGNIEKRFGAGAPEEETPEKLLGAARRECFNRFMKTKDRIEAFAKKKGEAMSEEKLRGLAAREFSKTGLPPEIIDEFLERQGCTELLEERRGVRAPRPEAGEIRRMLPETPPKESEEELKKAREEAKKAFEKEE